ncbi:MAG: TlpA disulfide reductase family protein, partial [Syntrophales bacterium]
WHSNCFVFCAMREKFIILIAILLLFSLPAFSQERGLYSKIGIQSVRDNIKTPDFCLDGLNVKKVQLKALKGNVILLNFWATWCGPCKEEMPSMEALYQQYRERDFVLLAISVDDGSPEPTRNFIQKHRYRFPVLLDPAGKTLDLFEIDRIPATVIIDKKGRMIGRAIGPRDWSKPEVFSLIDQMLDDRPKKVLSLKD